ncbi:glycerol-3-phosphate 1-O-acyltransferase PlsB [Acinetobacter gerneri]|uniref:glycerol-3-phosphate 1-O-acyltransferase PlsB n=1 Tax=Acinetobacter gerneri TaxID=202952 RepID=UPI0029366FB0|nr:glycerol-3-phosphate 1-O-acyltransferase PlsB [Acinetobacter gerneri]MDV2440406.1 glycerol-3-phosphate 1-O-acyltransferase PlsB [Acinetobacter gerneri]
MASNAYQKFYRQFTKKILDKIVSPQILGDTQDIENISKDLHASSNICYLIQDDSLSNQVLIDSEIEKRGMKSAFAPLKLNFINEEDSFLSLNKPKKYNEQSRYSEKLTRLIEYLQKHPDEDVSLIPVTVLWGRAPETEDSWYKALLSDAWSTPTKIKQTLNITLYGRENYIEFHQGVSLRGLIEAATIREPNYFPAHYVEHQLNQLFDQYKEAILGPDLSDRRTVIDKLMIADAIQEAIRTESINKKVSLLESEIRARSYLEEIVSDYSYSTIRFADIVLTKLWTQLYDGVEVHNFDMVRELAKDYEIIYTPCHRSHIDYLLLSYVIFKRGLMVPHIAAGINLNLPVFGQIARGAGAYFIRRSFNGNALYTAVFKEYVHSLLSRNTPLEYFIEGGRSRTGRLLPAKKGMLAMTIQSHLRGATKPIVFIPTYFGYEKLLEGTSYIKELGGEKKKAESIFGILKSIRKIEKVFGIVHVNFGEPVYLDPILKNNAAPEHLDLHDDVPESVKKTVNDVSIDILENINKAVVINPVSLLAFVLLNTPKQMLSERELIQRLEQYRTLLSLNPYDERMKITPLSNPEIIQYCIKLKQVEYVEHNDEPWVRVCDKQEALLKYFSNNILHTFVLTSNMAKILLAETCIAKSDLFLKMNENYPAIQAEFFLKWKVEELEAVYENILNYFKAENLIQDQDNQQIMLTANDAEIGLLQSLADVYQSPVSEK